mmetsp:Transcript_39362/g.93283  ORF Transcript_39362/g.93283 Transcript_39362/m.93283 type:complete len:113 (+) Transcript_39362:307-645(+)
MVYWFDFTRGFTEHFTVGDKLGEGAYGCTHICFEKSTGHEYAVKILRKEGMQPEDREAVQKEVKILKTVSQSIENIVVLYGVFEDSTAVRPFSRSKTESFTTQQDWLPDRGG